MPAKQKITKQDIVSAGLNIVRQGGMESLNARAIAAALGCSTQPIFSNYASMAELEADIKSAALAFYDEAILRAMGEMRYPPYKASGMEYIDFARREPQLFRLLYMCHRDSYEPYDSSSQDNVIASIMAGTGFDEETARRFHTQMWIWVHGVASMMATSFLPWDMDTVSQMMTEIYFSLRKSYEEEKK